MNALVVRMLQRTLTSCVIASLLSLRSFVGQPSSPDAPVRSTARPPVVHPRRPAGGQYSVWLPVRWRRVTKSGYLATLMSPDRPGHRSWVRLECHALIGADTLKGLLAALRRRASDTLGPAAYSETLRIGSVNRAVLSGIADSGNRRLHVRHMDVAGTNWVLDVTAVQPDARREVDVLRILRSVTILRRTLPISAIVRPPSSLRSQHVRP